MRSERIAAALLAVVALTLAGRALAEDGDARVGDVFDQFHRFTESEHRVFSQSVPGETVDPFTGTLSIVQEDLVLPGRAGLDIHIVRAYSSRIWGRADLLAEEPFLAEKANSVLGYGWSFHLGRLRNPHVIPPDPSDTCGGEFPVYEAPDGTAQVFYPVFGSNSEFRSKSFWLLRKGCGAGGGPGVGICVWTDTGIRYEFSGENQYFEGVVPVWPVKRIVDRFGNRIAATYVGRGAPEVITDSYDRAITFSYIDGVDGRRLDEMTVNGKTYKYLYTTYAFSNTSGKEGQWPLPEAGRRFLTEVKPPIGPSFLYGYAYDRTVRENQYALSSITYPSGGKSEYTYKTAEFFTGREKVPFQVVNNRIVGGRALVPGTWSYDYFSPEPPSGPPPPGNGPREWAAQHMHVTTITRPDGLQDRHTIAGFGYVAGWSTGAERNTFNVGLPLMIDRASGAEIEAFTWGVLPDTISPAPYSAPVYTAGNCGPYYVWDEGVYVPVLTKRELWRDGATYTTAYSDFDSYGQPRTVQETGKQASGELSRTTTWTYLEAPSDGAATLNLVRGNPLTQRVCMGEDCFENGWTYNADFHYARETETLSGTTTTFDYHRADPEGPGNLKSVTNAIGLKLTLTGYASGVGRGIPTNIDFNGAFAIIRVVSWEGWVTSETDGRGTTTGFEYDAIGRLKSMTPPGAPGENYPTSYEYAPDGSLTKLTRGPYVETSYLDGMGRVTSVANSEGVRTTRRYDNMGRAWFTSYPRDNETEVGEKLDFDGLGRIRVQTKAYRPATETCDVIGECRVTHNYLSNCVQTMVERKIDETPTTWRCSASLGDPSDARLVELWDANSSEAACEACQESGDERCTACAYWEFGYTVAGKLATVTTPLPNGDRAYGYDEQHFLRSETSGERGTLVFGRNAVGQMTNRTDGRPVVASFVYKDGGGSPDPLGRLRKISYQDGSAEDATFAYDNANNLTDVGSVNGGTYHYDYDELNRVRAQYWTYGGVTYTTTYRYDAAGCLDSMTYPSGVTLTIACDTANRVTRVSIGEAVIVRNVTYDSSGQPKSMEYGNGKTTAVSYDDRARVKGIASPGVIGLAYTYDGADNVRTLEDREIPNSQRTMTYDNLDRLITSIAPFQWGSTVYDYDALGNRTLSSVGSYATTYAYDDQNRLALATGGASALPSIALVWDFAGRLSSSSDGATYAYNGEGRRVRKTVGSVTTLYHYDASGRVLAETKGDGTKLRDYLYLGGKLLAVHGCIAADTPPCDDLEWYHTDSLGSVRVRTDSSGAVVARLDYDAWGEHWSVAGADGVRQYNGRVYDPGTGFHDYGARLYWPKIGRFLTADSYVGAVATPASLNRYTYVHNNPYRYVDPSGQFVVGQTPEQIKRTKDVDQFVQRMADISVDDKRSGITRAGAAVVGTIAGLGDSKTARKTEFVLSLAVFFGMSRSPAGVPRAPSLPDDALVCRGGACTAPSFARGSTIQQDGTIQGASVNTAPAGTPLEQLSAGIPHSRVGVTTVGSVRSVGGDVVPSPTPNNPLHGDLGGVTPQQAEQLFTPTTPNPNAAP